MKTCLIYVTARALQGVSIDLSDLGFPDPHEGGYYLLASRTPNTTMMNGLPTGYLFIQGETNEWMISEDKVEVLA